VGLLTLQLHAVAPSLYTAVVGKSYEYKGKWVVTVMRTAAVYKSTIFSRCYRIHTFRGTPLGGTQVMSVTARGLATLTVC
jgi:hypothetical protein